MSNSASKQVWAALATAILTLPIAANSGDFREAKWGMTKQEVKEIEGNSFVAGDDHLLLYEGKVSGLECSIGYTFCKDSLVEGIYVITEKHSDGERYRTDYIILKDKLSAKYGTPTKDVELYSYPYEKGDGHFDTALRTGKAKMAAYWVDTKSRTDICLSLAGDNHKVHFGIQYTSLDLAHLTEDENAKKDARDL